MAALSPLDTRSSSSSASIAVCVSATVSGVVTMQSAAGPSSCFSR